MIGAHNNAVATRLVQFLLGVTGCAPIACRMSDPEILFERRGVAGLVTLEPAQGTECRDPRHGAGVHRQLAKWADDPAVTRIVSRRPVTGHSPQAAIYASFTISAAPDATTTCCRSGVRSTRSTPSSSDTQAVRLADRWDRDGRRRRSLGAWFTSRRRRPLSVRDAGGKHRLFPRCGRDVVPAADARRTRRLLRAERASVCVRPMVSTRCWRRIGCRRCGFPNCAMRCAARRRSTRC